VDLDGVERWKRGEWWRRRSWWEREVVGAALGGKEGEEEPVQKVDAAG